MKIIVATSINGGIGYKNALPWNEPADLQWFKKMTLGQTVVMGRRTYESIGKPLPGRKNIVISRAGISLPPPGVTVVENFEKIFSLPDLSSIWICGGAQIYTLALPYCTDLYLTLIKKEVNADTFFPEYTPFFTFSDIIEDTPNYSIHHYTQKTPRPPLIL